MMKVVVCVSVLFGLSVAMNMKPACLGLFKDPIELCTGQELRDSMANVEFAYQNNMMPQADYDFVNAMAPEDFDCSANIFNNFFVNCTRATSLDDVSELMKNTDKCTPDFIARAKSYRDQMEAEVASAGSQFPVCTQLIKNETGAVFDLFKPDENGECNPFNLMVNSIRFFLRIGSIFTGNKKRCGESWKKTFPIQYNMFMSPQAEIARNYMRANLGKITAESLKEKFGGMLNSALVLADKYANSAQQ